MLKKILFVVYGLLNTQAAREFLIMIAWDLSQKTDNTIDDAAVKFIALKAGVDIKTGKAV
ncbi:hypothetical protein OAD88_07010 [Flavobacteriaceae bacterium]|nr:hypothetical protein [Flavobacteriaceae bacterium]